MLENPSTSSLFKDVGPREMSSMKNGALNAMTRGTQYTHCSGGTTWRKEAHVPSNWGVAGRMCNGHTAAHSCGEQRKHPISGGGKKERGNAAPLSFPKE